MKPILRLLTPLCPLLLAACLAAPDGAESPLESQELAAGSDGYHSQGTELHGTNVRSAAYGGATVLFGGSRRGATLRLDKGELVADMPLMLTGTTRSLQSCLLRGTGPERSCGFTVEGQGICTPGKPVTLTSGACSHEHGSCTGKPVVRVCAGEQPCEHGDRGHIAIGEYTCASTCPTVQFTCPSSGIYTVLAGPYTTGQTWSLTLAASAGRFPSTTRELRGRQLIGARMTIQPNSTAGHNLEVEDVISAASVPNPESPDSSWDPSGNTYLYHVHQIAASTGYTAELCQRTSPGADGGTDGGTDGGSDGGSTEGWAWAVPVRNLFALDGDRSDSTTAFTFGCDTGAIAKCYRWGYKPWLDGAQTGNVTKAHEACTRMARADYCGNGTPYTQDGTTIRMWDNLTPAITTPPESGTQTGDLHFEAGWRRDGPSCLSHWRWNTLQAPCVTLRPPIYGPDGGIVNHCLYQAPDSPYNGENCSQVCDTPEEAAQYYNTWVFNQSALNGADGGTGP